MKAYKIWYETKHYIHKDTTAEGLNLTWTEKIEDAKDIEPKYKASKFFFDTLGFNMNAKYDTLHLL